MNLELIKRSGTDADKTAVEALSRKTNLHPVLTELLICRGIDSVEAINNFLNPDIGNFYDPFLFKGMKEAAERIETAIENDERVIVYGDYDADGVCAAAILSLYLADRGLNVYTHIPSRSGEGYGLSVESLERIIEQALPDLIITCDCGISGHREVEFAKSLGVDVIVTDHHEVSDTVPDCVVINPKLSGCNYPIDYLCGAGVALKVVQALGGIEKAAEYFDLAAVATIADLVPLLDENRLIVQLGLKDVNKMNKGLRALLLNQQIDKNVTSSDIAYKIAPRINAAGRMGDAYRAFELLTTNDKIKIDTIVKEINDDNNKRKILCDDMYSEALELIKSENLTDSRAVILSHPTWEKGITGILAARIAGDFKRPSFILVNSGDSYKGTSRSINGINIYELLSSLKDILLEYGGHSQAAGFSILKENIPVFKERISKYLEQFDKTLFMPSCEYDTEIELGDITTPLAKALEKMEPFGNSNPRPVFVAETEKLEVSPCKNNYCHTNIVTSGGLTILAFNYYNSNQFLLGAAPKRLALEVSLNTFGSKESPKAVLKAVKPDDFYINNSAAKAGYLKTLELSGEKKAVFAEYAPSDLARIVPDSVFGTLIIAGCEETYLRIQPLVSEKIVLSEFMYSTNKNNYSKIIVSPLFDAELMLSNYSKVIFADPPLGTGIISYLNSKTDAEIFIPKASDVKSFLENIDVSRETFSLYFDVIRRNTDINALNIFTYFKILSSRAPNLELKQFIACYLVFSELNFISVQGSGFSLKMNQGVKSDLNNSACYNYLKERV